MNTSNNKQSAFTIVELLVVIVVIGILAAITIVSYTGIANKAILVTLQSDLSSASRQLKLFKIVDSNEYYPTTINCAIPDSTTNKCIKPSGNSYYSLYTPNNTTNPRTFILEETNGTIIYRITDDSTPVAVVVIPITAIAAITGTTVVGNVLTAGALTPAAATATYQWQSATTAGGTYTNIAGATAGTYTLVGGDWTKYIKVVATATGSYSGTQTSAASSVVLTSITNIAAITGTTAVGSVLTAGALTPSGTTASYQWQNAISAGGTYTNISGATASTYALAISDVGKYLKVIATATGSYSGIQTSAASAVIIPAPTQGPLSPGTMADVTYQPVAWTNPNNAKVSDGVYALAGPFNGVGAAISHYLDATNFGFSIPTGAIINGILVEIEKYASNNTSNTNVTDYKISLIKADGSKSSTNKADTVTLWPTIDPNSYISYGSSSDLWGETWDSTRINNINFGVTILTYNLSRSVNITAYIDHIRIKVYYTTP